MAFNSESDQQLENTYDEEYIERDYPTRQDVKREREKREDKELSTGRNKKKAINGGFARVIPKFRFPSSNKKKKMEMFWLKLVFKILVVGAVYFNFKYLLNYMNNPISNFKDTLIVFGVCAGINLLAVWILFYKNSLIRFYLSLFAIVGSFVYYGYVNYLTQSFLGNNMIASVLVIISVLMVINPKINYYFKNITLLLIPVIGIYFSGNKFALVWALMFNAGLILLFRVPKSNEKEEEQTKRNKKQSA
ncbi:hypothetical protein PH210_06710 [Paenibacillus sp. BSR1-1]|uniref:hypothetical protein n=1 Tax=Paenibacillus sp. BSR1-1 TaxID=3020845 RepID=UPI0025AF39DD|nr:hypothetical protein [Paenibacillus sp. BSR1-1]MDN3015898.1 hypothetical protein [Paenibacillus sp. BSR1-1]